MRLSVYETLRQAPARDAVGFWELESACRSRVLDSMRSWLLHVTTHEGGHFDVATSTCQISHAEKAFHLCLLLHDLVSLL